MSSRATSSTASATAIASPPSSASDEELRSGPPPVWSAGVAPIRWAEGVAAGYAAVAIAAGGRTRAHLVSGGTELVTSDSRSPLAFANMAHLMAPAGATASAGVGSAALEFYRAGPGGPWFLWDAWSELDLDGHGHRLVGRPPIMVRPPATATRRPDDLLIREVHTPDRLRDFERVLVEAYPAPELQPFGAHPLVYADSLLGGCWRFFVGYHRGRAVATAAATATDHVVCVEAVSTRPECRGRGWGGALTDAAAAAWPDRPAALVASDLGRGVYERLGFETVGRAALWVGVRPGG